VVSEAFVVALLRFRSRGGRQWKLARDHGISPSLLSSTITGARPCAWDPRVEAIGVALGLKPEEVFLENEEPIAS